MFLNLCHADMISLYFQVGALQDVRSELTKLRGVLFYKVLEDVHAHLYNKGEYRLDPLLYLKELKEKKKREKKNS